ncbi:hypothetical protein PQE75_gp166 [Bacillus phage vB_BcoS-136]|uniref:Uncharacterized protein n=1 Tax=Bacillus phage vB_BcoS-136 TaxID=2419619 RepID=A0A3G3BVP4_9CAUD|nr:hypothetical protein PQE75_gp166 [Bacillus phage vB_BcoS-136]AYP68313.1 hypothetical protein vBBcoS136_00199 [Bacillus phage vB_BcoS-136]
MNKEKILDMKNEEHLKLISDFAKQTGENLEAISKEFSNLNTNIEQEKSLEEILEDIAKEEGMSVEQVRKLFVKGVKDMRGVNHSISAKEKAKRKAKKKQAKKSKKKNR